MKLVSLQRAEGDRVAINVENIEMVVPEGERTTLHMVSGKSVEIAMPMAELIQNLTQQGWRK